MTLLVKYIHLRNGEAPPTLEFFVPFKTVVMSEMAVDVMWQSEISDWLVKAGCLYMCALGVDCSSWDDSVDVANLEMFNFGDLPDENHVMTTWHENETLDEVIDFAVNSARHDYINSNDLLLLHIAETERKSEFENSFEAIVAVRR